MTAVIIPFAEAAARVRDRRAAAPVVPWLAITPWWWTALVLIVAWACLFHADAGRGEGRRS